MHSSSEDDSGGRVAALRNPWQFATKSATIWWRRRRRVAVGIRERELLNLRGLWSPDLTRSLGARIRAERGPIVVSHATWRRRRPRASHKPEGSDFPRGCFAARTRNARPRQSAGTIDAESRVPAGRPVCLGVGTQPCAASRRRASGSRRAAWRMRTRGPRWRRHGRRRRTSSSAGRRAAASPRERRAARGTSASPRSRSTSPARSGGSTSAVSGRWTPCRTSLAPQGTASSRPASRTRKLPHIS